MKFEELIIELEQIVKELESGKLSLEESVEKYKRSLELNNLCKQKLEEAKNVVVNKMKEE